MNTLISFPYVFWFWSAGAVAIGVTTGLAIEIEPPEKTRRASLVPLAVLFGAAVLFFAFDRFMNGRIEVYAATGLYFSAVFLASAAAGTLAVRRPLRIYDGWIWGLAPLALAWLIATWAWLPLWQADAKAEIEEIARKVKIDASDVSFSGRDVLLTPREAGNAWFGGEVARLAGVRYVLFPEPLEAAAPLASPSAGAPFSSSVVEAAPAAYAEPVPLQSTSAPSVPAAPLVDQAAQARDNADAARVATPAKEFGVRHLRSHHRRGVRH